MKPLLTVGRIQRCVAAMLLACAASTSAQDLLVDFGPNDGVNGNITTTPDYWNNATGPVVSDLQTTDNVITDIDISFTTNFATNGILNGGLLAPSPALLGEYAVATATQDYFFTTSSFNFELRELDPSKAYDLFFFGTRETTASRVTRYSATGDNGQQMFDLQTSGEAIGDGGYNGNNDTLAVIAGVIPDANNVISIDVSVVSGGFAYLGAMGISVVPEPASSILICLAGLMLRRR
jgi:hypothetical protein